MNDKIYCPMTNCGMGSFNLCSKETCAWWDKDNESCAVLSVAKNLYTVKELAEGYRTLFVREC